MVLGSGVAYPKSWLSGCKLATLDSESFLGALLNPTLVQLVEARLVSAIRVL